MGLKRRPGAEPGTVEPWLEWQKRSMSKAYSAIRKCDCSIGQIVVENRNKWAGHVARFGLGNRPQHLLKSVLFMRCKDWWTYQTMYKNLNLNPVLHATRGKPYSWEDNVGVEWAYNASLQEFWAPTS